MRSTGRKTCVACSYIILYGWLCRNPSLIQRERRPRNIWPGALIYTGIKMSRSPPAILRHRYHLLRLHSSLVREFSRPLHVLVRDKRDHECKSESNT